MRIIHTSDWHLGRRFEREPLEDDQRAFLAWLADLVEERQVDLVIVAGDVYDRSSPAEDAVTLLDRGLDGLRAAGAQVVLIPGNHDSARRLGFGAGRQALGGVHVFADDRLPPAPGVLVGRGERVALVAVPFLDPTLRTDRRPADDGTPRPATHQSVLADALDAGRRALPALGGVASIAVVHAYVSGAGLSDSERTLAIGGADQVDPAVLDGFDYVALGHLHRPQRIGGSDAVAYSGSPLPYSFSEDHPKSVRLLEVEGGRLTGVSTVPVPVGRKVVTLTGTLDRLLTDPAHERYTDHWVAARLADDTVRTQPMERLRARFPHAVNVRYDDPRTGALADFGSGGPPIEERPDEEVVLELPGGGPRPPALGLRAPARARRRDRRPLRSTDREAPLPPAPGVRLLRRRVHHRLRPARAPRGLLDHRAHRGRQVDHLRRHRLRPLRRPARVPGQQPHPQPVRGPRHPDRGDPGIRGRRAPLGPDPFTGPDPAGRTVGHRPRGGPVEGRPGRVGTRRSGPHPQARGEGPARRTGRSRQGPVRASRPPPAGQVRGGPQGQDPGPRRPAGPTVPGGRLPAGHRGPPPARRRASRDLRVAHPGSGGHRGPDPPRRGRLPGRRPGLRRH